MFDFLEPLQLAIINGDNTYNAGQYGDTILKNTTGEVHWQDADIVLLGVNEERGKGQIAHTNSTDVIRAAFYKLYQWHNTVSVADIGNIKIGKSLTDTYAAVQVVVQELLAANKTVLLLGGSHDVSLAQYNAYAKSNRTIEATVIDATIDLSLESKNRSDNFLVELLTGEPNYVHHYNHLGFQSYFVHPTMMETLDGLRFDCHRVGKVRQNIGLYEPVLRNSNMVSMDITAIQNAYMPCNTLTPNGFAGDEACTLAKYAGNSNALSTFGLYNYNAAADTNGLGATQIAQMIWYFIDGRHHLLQEKALTEKSFYNEYITAFADVTISFYQNKENNKWWMQMPNGSYIACNKEDYIQVSQNDLPEMWLRHQERN